MDDCFVVLQSLVFSIRLNGCEMDLEAGSSLVDC